MIQMSLIRIQALEWVQGRTQDLILDNITTDWPVYNDDEQMYLEKQVNDDLNLLLCETYGIITI